MQTKITIILNGKERDVLVEPQETLLRVLRDKLYMKSVKEGCNAQECGACTVIVNGNAINSCGILAIECNGALVETVEGLSEKEKLHPLQQAFIKNSAVQCGFCTPGMLMSAKALLNRNPEPTEEDIRIAISGNLCRCTGYRQIIDAIKEASVKSGGADNE
jgi:carbon-monoxide dehydrogenase small subunit